MPATRKRSTTIGATRTEPSVQVLRQFRVVFNAVKTHFRQVEKRAGVGGAQLWALSIVRKHPGIGVNDLASAMDIRQSTASNLVRSLVERKLIKAEKGSIDRRTVQLRLRPSGIKVLRKAPAPFTGVLPKALAELDRATLSRMSKDLAKLITAVHAEHSGAGRRPLADM
jgi:DNA-binding MarR family transcriptional regulator